MASRRSFVWPSRLRPYGRHFCSTFGQECTPGWPFSQLAVCARHHEPAPGTPRSGVEMAVFDPGWGTSDDPRRRRNRGPSGHLPRCRRLVGLVRPLGAGHRPRPHGEQPHERPLRPRGRYRPGGLPPQPLLAPPRDLGRHHPKGSRDLRPRRQRPLPRHHDRAHRRPGLAHRRLRPRRLPALGRLHRAAAAAEEARPRRADRADRVGTVDGRRQLLRRHGHDPRAPSCSPRCRTRCSARPC